MSGNGSGIMVSRKAAEFLDSFRKNLAARMTLEGPEGSRELLLGLNKALADEATAGHEHADACRELIAGLTAAAGADELAAAGSELRRRLIGQFAARPAASTIYDLSAAFHDRLLEVALDVARPASAIPLALLVTGGLGRRESINLADSSLLLVHADTEDVDATGKEVAQRLAGILRLSSKIWSGSVSEWEKLIRGTLLAEPASGTDIADFARALAQLADLRVVCGDADLPEEIGRRQFSMLASAASSELFRQVAGEITVMPVALGIFGRFKTIRSGLHRGKFPLVEQALAPLCDTMRILAVDCGITDTGTASRIRQVLAAGEIGVTLADSIAAAFTEFSREKLRLELAPEAIAGEQFLDPEDLQEEQRERLRTGLEYVATLQRLAYQQLVEAER